MRDAAAHTGSAAVGLTRRFEGTTVLRDIDFRAAFGQTTAVVGPSGSGKSTLLYCLAGLQAASGGTVTLLDVDPVKLTRGRLARLYRDDVGFVFQNYNLVSTLTARENIALPLRLSGRKVDWVLVDAALEQVGLAQKSHSLPARLSGGEQQRVAIARAIVKRPKVIFADEPTGALDQALAREMTDLLFSLAADAALVLVTHDLDLATKADRAYCLVDGAVTGVGSGLGVADLMELIRKPARN